MPHPLNIKFELIALLACMMALLGLSMDIMLPAFGDIAQDLAISNVNHTQYIVILFIFGMVFGELVFGPLADAIGRKKIILIGLTIYGFGAFIAAASDSFEVLLYGRIIQGIGVAGPKIGSRALVRDLYEGAVMARIMSILFGLLILVPMVAPLLGQFIIQASHWRFLFVGFMVISIALGLWLAKRQPETLKPKNRIPIAFKSLLQNTILILKHRQAVSYMLCAGFVFGAQLCYLALAHAIFVDLYQVGDKFPLYFALVAIGMGIGSFGNANLVKYFGMHYIINTATISIFAFSLVFLLASFIYAGVPPLYSFIIYCCAIFLLIGVIFGNLSALAMQHMGRVAGLASSLFASISSLMAVLVSSLFGSFYNATTFPLTLMFLLAGGASFILVRRAQKSKAQPV
ncbi:MAG: multidrug effflux MFS transporter [Alphaproteobacteria bacterium]|nr:multidrug effflux MFS transporter [Alphaproteobacteria bacterium]